MKQSIFKNIRLVAFCLILAIGASYAHAAWVNPDSTPPFDNINPVNNAPVNSGGIDQYKAGSLSVDVFNVAGSAQFNQQLFINGGIVRAGNIGDPVSTVSFGTNTDAVTAHTSGGVRATQYLRSTELANFETGQVCADEAGDLVLCP